MKLVYRTLPNGQTSKIRKLIFEPEDDEYIISQVEAGVSQKKIAEHFAKWCSLTHVRARIKKICPTELIKRVFEPPSLQKTTCYGKSSWSRTDDAILTRLYPDTSNEEIAIKLGRTTRQVLRRARILQLRKSNEFVAKTCLKNREKGGIISRGKKNKDSLCIGRFCMRREDCNHYIRYIEERRKGIDIPIEITLNGGHTTRCIGECGSYYNFQPIED